MPYFEFLPPELCDSALRKELVEDEFAFVGGKVPLPEGPGLGVRLDPDAVRRFEQAADALAAPSKRRA
jgi:L-alanine-DL-glutamate epimerase-like enolase superfamily enzyme